MHQVLDLGHKWVPEPGLRRLAHAAALPEETAIVDDSDLRSLVIPWSVATGSSAMTQASCPGGTAVVSAFAASISVPSAMRTRSGPDC
jgi:hypothetical protein